MFTPSKRKSHGSSVDGKSPVPHPSILSPEESDDDLDDCNMLVPSQDIHTILKIPSPPSKLLALDRKACSQVVTSKEYLEQLEKDLEAKRAKIKAKEEKQCAKAARQQAKKIRSQSTKNACEVFLLCSVVTTNNNVRDKHFLHSYLPGSKVELKLHVFFVLGFCSSSDDTCTTSQRQPTKSRRSKQSHQVFGNRTRLHVTLKKLL